MTSHSLQGDIDVFIEALRSERGYSPHTCRAYRKDLEALAAFVAERKVVEMETLHVSDVDELALRRYIAFLHKRLKKSTIARKLSAVRSFFHFLFRTGVVAHSPAVAVMTPKQEQHIPRLYFELPYPFCESSPLSRHAQKRDATIVKQTK